VHKTNCKQTKAFRNQTLLTQNHKATDIHNIDRKEIG